MIGENTAYAGQEGDADVDGRLPDVPLDRTIVGRTHEVATLSAAVDRAGSGYCVVILDGDAGIGKSALWSAALKDAADRGYQLFVTRATESEASLSYGGLTDLLAHVSDRVLSVVPVPQRRALAAVMLQDDHEALDARAVGQGFLTVVRESAKHAPVVIAIDDEHWLDAATTEALNFALRRLRDEYVLVLATLRDGEPSNLEAIAANVPDVTRIGVVPLTLDGMRQMLDRLPGVPALSGPTAARVHHMSGGNPLYAREIASALGRDDRSIESHADLPVPRSLAALLAARVRRVSQRSHMATLIVALLTKPTFGLVRGALSRFSDTTAAVTAALDSAVTDGLLVYDDGHIRLHHPLIGAAVIAETPAGDVRRVHLVLAEVIPDAEERVRHRALGTVGPDAELATELERVANIAADRGNALASWELARFACRFTPEQDEHRDTRLVEMICRGNRVGAREEALLPFEADIRDLPRGPLRARGVFEITRIKRTLVTDDAFVEALAEADPPLQVEILAEMASMAFTDGLTMTVALEWGRQAAMLAQQVGDPVATARAENELAYLEIQAGIDARGRLAAVDRSVSNDFALHDQPDRTRALYALWRGDLTEARLLLDGLRSQARERDEEWSQVIFTLHTFEMAVRIGDWTLAARLSDELAVSAQIFERPAIALRARATVGAITGDRTVVDRALRLVNSHAPNSSVWHRIEILRAAGLSALLDGRAALAAERLRMVADLIADRAFGNPGAFPYAPDLVEALARTGELDAARSELALLDAAAVEQDHPWALAVAERARGLIFDAGKADDEAEAAYRLSIDRCRALGLRFDEARATAALGDLKRRTRQFREARTLLSTAISEFEALGATVPAATARADLARIGGRRSSLGLTPTEERVVELVTSGATNRQAATRLHIGIGAVEAHLTRIYAKVGVQSRTQLVRHMVELQGVDPTEPFG